MGMSGPFKSDSISAVSHIISAHVSWAKFVVSFCCRLVFFF